MSDGIRVVQVGLGPIGRQLARAVLEHPRLTLAGALDIDPDLVDRDLGELLGLDQPLGLPVLGQPAGLAADVAMVTTSSDLTVVAATIVELLEQNLHVISTCEELAYPWKAHPVLSREIDESAKAASRCVVGTGVNPGYLMDLLPVVLTGPCRRVESVRVERHQDAGQRRLPFQQKIGAGLDREAFQNKVNEGGIRHVGLTESMHLIAERMNWALERAEDVVEPVIAEQRVASEQITVEPGRAAGVHQVGRAWTADGRQVIELIFHAAIGVRDPRDTVVIEGEPRIESTIAGGVHGDAATTAMAINCIPLVRRGRPGLRTMTELDPVSCFQG